MQYWAKKFTQASLIYLLVGTFLGIFLGMDPYWTPRLRFVHIHFNLLGFMTMMIAGVAYHVLPRFNNRPVPWEKGVAVQFYLQNIGLLGMTESYMAGGMWSGGASQVMFIVFALTTWSALCIMFYNLFFVLRPLKEKGGAIEPGWKVSEVLDQYPDLLSQFVEAGFNALENPVARKTLAGAITVEKACEKHGVEVSEFVRRLNELIGTGKDAEVSQEDNHPMGATISRGETCRPDIMVGSVIRIYPETKPVFEKFYGKGCFDCPGQAFETVEQTASMHNVPVQVVLNELNRVIEASLKT